ncbi:uncharacterized sulfatase [Haloarcula vallismortis]|uniref:Sulfatase n=2 Tax=Haloarcula vallismortis TaxID=28442 RepID=M0JQE5_HALVA|nr:sulfatase [Haloarcula vallismortis]EMA10204.1 sulfatase [Haloarcula vallismortis ATCC 29715]SDX30312.1 uncharacterized sulfatase [Haloarcula vallismortis]
MSTPNIVWITLDSLRSDHTTIGGYERDTTPEMADIADSGHGFDTCIAHGKSTLPSSGAILTGYAPTHTNIGIEGNAVPDGITTVAERFRNAGYRTACLSRNSYLSSATNLDRGFDRFQWLASSTIHQVGAKTLASYLWNIRSHSAGLTMDTSKHASPLLMNGVAKRWLGDFESKSKPFFFYLHYNEPHRPYYPPGKYLDTFTDDLEMSGREAAELALDIHYNLDEIVANGCDLSKKEWAALRAMYDSEIAYTDEMVGQLVSELRSLNLGDTIIVVTGDHGELFGEWGLLSHSYVLNDAVTRVPLVIDGLEDPLAVDDGDIIQHSDIMRTLLEVAGVDGSDTIGVDLREEGREFAVSQRGPNTYEELLTHNSDFDYSALHTETLSALRTEEWRYQESAESAELFNLADEETDVREAYPEVAESLQSDLDDWIEANGQPVSGGQQEEFSGAVQRQLRDLGYME